jgi:leader peptidase (prepilin peptidase)/N-methyltransferase
MDLETYTIIVATVFGAIMGSFMNVLIYRLPRGESVVGGRSHCPGCRMQIAARDNIPIISWLLLLGRCRGCRWKIPARYPGVELISAATAGLAIWHFGTALQAVWIWAFVTIMMMITFIDWEHQIIPDPLSIGGTVLGWVGAVVCLEISLVDSFIGSLVGGGVILLIAVAYKSIRKVHGMGGGDVKLMAMVGAFLGWQMVMPVLFVGAFFGSIYGFYLMRAGDGHGKTAVAFGSFLAPAACIMMFVGQPMLTWYLGTMPR